MAAIEVPCLRVLELAHEVRGVHWSPDGTRLAIADAGGFEVRTVEGRPLWRREQRCIAIRWSPDGGKIASGHAKELVVSDSDTGQVILRCHLDGYSNSLRWAPDSSKVASSGAKTYLFDASTGEVLVEINQASNAVTLSPDGTRLAFVGNSPLLGIWSALSGEEQEVIDRGKMDGFALLWSRSGRYLACPTRRHLIELWNVKEKAPIGQLAGHSRRIRFMEDTVDGALVASCSDDYTVRLWLPEKTQQLALLEGHAASARSIAFSPDCTRLASASTDHTIRIWDVTALHQAHARPFIALETYAARQAASVGRWAAQPVRWVPGVTRYKGTGDLANGVAILADGRSAVLGYDDGSVRRVDLVSGEDAWRGEERHNRGTDDITLSMDGRLVASSGKDGLVRVWEAASGRLLVKAMLGPRVMDSSLSPLGDRGASALVDDTVRVWRLDTGGTERELRGHGRRACAVDWHPGGGLLASAGGDSMVRIWDVGSGVEVHRIEAHTASVYAVRWSPDGTLLASGSEDHTVALLRPGRGNEVERRLSGHAAAVTCVAWSPDGRLLASGADDASIRVWDPATGAELHRFDFDARYAWRLSWAPSSAFLAASLGGDSVRIFDTRHLLPVAPRPSRAAAPPSASGPDLQHLPTAAAALVRLGLTPPLSHLQALQRLLAGAPQDDPPHRPLASHRGLLELAALRWPTAALPGLLALLLRRAPRDPAWAPPPAISPTELRDALAEALAGEPVEPQAPPLPLAAITQAADEVDDRLLTLLELVGPGAVTADPGLPLRLLAQVPRLPALAAPRRKLLGLRLRLDQGGQAQGSGPGAERSGIDRRGDLCSLLPSQLTLPPRLLRARYLRGDLLYRARTGQEPPRLRPTVLLLDVSPPTFGPVEALTRLAAHALASSLLEAGLPVVLLTAGGEGSLHVLERAADLVEIWTRRSLEPPDEAAALRGARALREGLAADGLPPIVVVLSHVHFGADRPAPKVPCLRGLFVDFPGRRLRPALADDCERWTSLAPADTANLHRELAALVG